MPPEAVGELDEGDPHYRPCLDSRGCARRHTRSFRWRIYACFAKLSEDGALGVEQRNDLESAIERLAMRPDSRAEGVRMFLTDPAMAAMGWQLVELLPLLRERGFHTLLPPAERAPEATL